MQAKQTKYHPRLSDDVGEVLSKLAKKNGRTLPQELDFILRPILFDRRHYVVGMTPDGESCDPDNAVKASIAEELNRISLRWDKKKKVYVTEKAKR